MYVEQGGQALKGLDTGKARELFSYLLIHNDHPHSREVLAALLWGDKSTAQSKKYLRHTLWQLKSTFDTRSIFTVEQDWVQLNSSSGVWVDVIEFEKVYNRVMDLSGDKFDIRTFELVHDTVELYRGDLLQGWYYDWCIFDRERLQNAYLMMLEKLIRYCEEHKEYERGICYGENILRLDRARERTHRRMMRLYYLHGNRSAALRQYKSCRASLQEELAVEPSRKTVDLYKQISEDQLNVALNQPNGQSSMISDDIDELGEVLGLLYQFRSSVEHIQDQLQNEISRLESRMNVKS